jgi:hypothetical protein
LPVGFVFAQTDATPIETSENRKKLHQLDDLLVVAIPATLTGLSVTGASFLVRIAKDNLTEIELRNTTLAKKNFIKAFTMFLSCIVILFVFDFVEIIQGETAHVLIADLVLTYTTFGVGLAYLVRAARRLYSLFGR